VGYRGELRHGRYGGYYRPGLGLAAGALAGGTLAASQPWYSGYDYYGYNPGYSTGYYNSGYFIKDHYSRYSTSYHNPDYSTGSYSPSYSGASYNPGYSIKYHYPPRP
jgi:hypothetical protein